MAGNGVVIDATPDIDSLIGYLQQVAYAFCDWATDRAVENIKNEIPPPQGAGVFPGWKAEGKLKNAVRRTPVTGYGPRGWSATVYMLKGGETDVYDHVHERGMVIRAKNVPFMVFEDEGGVIKRRKQVYIKPKLYFFSGIMMAIQDANAVVSSGDLSVLKASMGVAGKAGRWRPKK